VHADGIALVTGASRGIGRAVALELARAGFQVIATMRETTAGEGLPEEARAAGGRLAVEHLDVTRPQTIRLPEGLRVLVNNAGIEGDHHPLESTPIGMWRELVDTNLLGVVETTSRAIPLMRAAGGGVICNITSSSLLVPVPFFAPYRATKAAVGALGESLRAEVAPFGIRVVEIMPGAIDTDMFEESGRPLAALQHQSYVPLAERFMRSRSGIQGTPVTDAARAIVAAILDDSGPLRYGCDPMGNALLEWWRAVSDEEMMRSMLPVLG
jgi:NAD(P)-dependent dehydrogenase (short-subunit alcohol dehydrogenase family)